MGAAVPPGHGRPSPGDMRSQLRGRPGYAVPACDATTRRTPSPTNSTSPGSKADIKTEVTARRAVTGTVDWTVNGSRTVEKSPDRRRHHPQWCVGAEIHLPFVTWRVCQRSCPAGRPARSANNNSLVRSSTTATPQATIASASPVSHGAALTRPTGGPLEGTAAR